MHEHATGRSARGWWIAGLGLAAAVGLGAMVSGSASGEEERPEEALDQPLRTFVLLESRGFTHPVVNPGHDPVVVAEVFDEMAEKAPGLFEHTVSFDARELTPERLAETDLVVFFTTGDLPLPDYEAFDQWVRDGGRFLGTHSATDTMHGNETYIGMIGGRFQSHPWNANDEVTIKVQDDEHPAAKPFAPHTTFREEIYMFDPFHYQDVRVLISLDMERTEKKRPQHIPIAWCREYGDGRVFYTSLGHNEHIWRSDAYQEHLIYAIRWLADLVKGSAEPNPELHVRENEIAAEAAR